MKNLYTGCHLRKVDNCYRIKIPNIFIFSNEGKGYFLYYDKSKNTVYAYPKNHIADLEQYGESLLEINYMLTVSLSDGIFVDFDKYHRILLPKNMRKVVDMSRNVVVIGSFDHIEIMPKEQFEQITDTVNE